RGLSGVCQRPVWHLCPACGRLRPLSPYRRLSSCQIRKPVFVPWGPCGVVSAVLSRIALGFISTPVRAQNRAAALYTRGSCGPARSRPYARRKNFLLVTV